jgi:hypothetical protein
MFFAIVATLAAGFLGLKIKLEVSMELYDFFKPALKILFVSKSWKK